MEITDGKAPSTGHDGGGMDAREDYLDLDLVTSVAESVDIQLLLSTNCSTAIEEKEEEKEEEKKGMKENEKEEEMGAENEEENEDEREEGRGFAAISITVAGEEMMEEEGTLAFLKVAGFF